jgi:ketosteroid isomerase-like protein
VSEANVAILMEFNQALAARGEVRWDLLDPNVEIFDHDIPDAGSYHGHQGLGKWLEDWGAAWESWEIGPARIEDLGDTVLSVFEMVARGKGSGIETRRRNATLNTIADGRVVRIDYFTTEEEARAAAKHGTSVQG